MYVCVYIYTYICMYVYIYIYMHIYIYISLCIYIYMSITSFTSGAEASDCFGTTPLWETDWGKPQQNLGSQP